MSNEIFKAYNLLMESSDSERLKKIFTRYELFKLSQDILHQLNDLK